MEKDINKVEDEEVKEVIEMDYSRTEYDVPPIGCLVTAILFALFALATLYTAFNDK